MEGPLDKLAPDVVIIGAGPAGLTAGRRLGQAGMKPLVLEKDEVVGGISKTVSHDGYLFDIGGHRFFTKVKPVEDFWHEVMQDDFLLRSRSSRIFYNGKFFDYPLKPLNALFGLGLWTSLMVALSYVYAHLFPIKDERSFEHWIVNRFGARLYGIFFKTYTEKVWGTPCSQISAEWAAQRIKGLSLKTALIQALVGNRGRPRNEVIKTLIDSFHYPKRGPGMMWEKVAADLADQGHKVLLNAKVAKIRWEEDSVQELVVEQGDGLRTVTAPHFISSMPIRELIENLEPAAPAEVRRAAQSLKYRDFLTVAIIVDKEHLFADNWIYIHDDSVRVGRIQNFKNWSPYMVPDPGKTCLGLEYFCFEGDGLWTLSDEELVDLAGDELHALGLANREEIENGAVVRMPKAYPVYDQGYAESVDVIREFLGTLDNLQLVGRNGMHKYNNQDHSMLTAMLAVDNIRGANHDLWSVNAEQEYHEELTEKEVGQPAEYAALAASQPLVPQTVNLQDPVDQALSRTFARTDKAALATAIGTVCGVMLFGVTAWMVLNGQPVAMARLQLLSEYFYGYTVTFSGAALGLVYGFFWGFLFGWLLAYLRNFTVGLYVGLIAHRARSPALKRVLDYI